MFLKDCSNRLGIKNKAYVFFSQVILTCLDLELSHYSKITGNESIEGETAPIHYSKPYDFLIADEREELIDAMLRLAMAQRGN